MSSLVTVTVSKSDLALADEFNALADVESLDLLALNIDFEPGTASEVVFNLGDATLKYDVKKQVLTHVGVDENGKAKVETTLDKLAPRDGVVSLRLLIDRLSVEAYGFGGGTFSAHYIDPNSAAKSPSIHAVGGEAKIRKLTLWKL